MNHLLTPAYPTFPVQDKFGNVQLFPGLTKLEQISAMIFAESQSLYTNGTPYEERAKDAVDMAVIILNAVQDKMIELSQPPKPSLTIHKP
jgi:hypothetical protein